MPPVIQTPLPKIAFSKNPIFFRVLSGDYLTTLPQAAINYLDFPGAVAADTLVPFSWTGAAATMTAKAAPNDSGLQFPTGDGSYGYVQTLLPWFQGNYFLNRAFIITADNTAAHPRIIFTAKKKGPDYNFTAGFNIGVSTVGVTDAPKENFRHHIQLWIQDAFDTDYMLAYSANVPLDTPQAGVTSNDIHEALHAFLEADRPELNAIYAQCVKSIRSYYLLYGQFFGSDPAVQRLFRSDNFIVAKGGLSMLPALSRDIKIELCVNPADTSTWRFCRQGSENKLVRKDQPEWLTWINLTDGPQQIQLEVKIYNSDNGAPTTFYTADAFAAAQFTKYQFQVGYSQLNIGGRQPAGKVPVYYTAQLKGAAGYLSTLYTFVIEYQYQEWPRYFVYENAYGAYQTIATVGRGQSEFDRNKSDAQLAVDKGTAAYFGEFLETNITLQDRFTANVGYSRSGRRNTRLLRDFFASHNIFLYDRGNLIPVGINSKNAKDAADGVNLYAGTFEYYPKYEEEVFTEEPGLAGDPVTYLLGKAGGPVSVLPPAGIEFSLSFTINYGDGQLSVVGDQMVYSAFRLTGRGNYPVYSTQLGRYFFISEISYNADAGNFTVLLPAFRLQAGDQLIIYPHLLNPDEAPLQTDLDGVIVVNYGDIRLSINNDHQVYAALKLNGRNNYTIWSTQLSRPLYSGELTYDPANNSFAILIPGFRLQNGDQLIISPNLLNP